MKVNKKIFVEEIEKNRDKMKGFGVKEIGLFGSVLKNKQNAKSDIDVIIEFKKVSFDNYAEVLLLLEKLFKKKIDLITKDSLRPELEYIKKEAQYVRI